MVTHDHNMTRILDGRNAPFCWQEKDVIRRLQTYAQKKEALAIYLTLTLMASDNGGKDIEEYGIAIQDQSGVGRDSLRIILNEMLDDGLIEMKRLPATRNKVYGKLSIKLLSRKICKLHGIQCNLQCKPPSKKQSSLEDNILSKDNNKEKKDKDFVHVPPYLENAFHAFVEMRVKTKKPMTAHAKDLLLKKLIGMSSDESMQISILNKSITNSWSDVYPLKDDEKTKEQINNEVKMRVQRQNDLVNNLPDDGFIKSLGE